jgi:prevent-host-death family protein
MVMSIRPDIDELASTQPLAVVKARFSEMVDRTNAFQDRITITRNGVPVAVLLSADDFEALIETIDILSDPQAMAAIEEARAEKGGMSEEEVRHRYLP